MKRTIALIRRLLTWPKRAKEDEIALFCAEKNLEAMRAKLLSEQARLRDAQAKLRESWVEIDELRKTNREMGELCEQHEQAGADSDAMREAWRILAAAFPAITELEGPKQAAHFIANIAKGAAQ